jgi:type I restriction-modification system DNA methylase subunit
MKVLARATDLDWASVEPAIFGTLFERSLDPSKRAQLGAHYTSRADIELIVEPVLMAPLRRRWEEVRPQAEDLATKRDAASGAMRTRHEQALQRLLIDFIGEIAKVRVLDAACGSGNFLYVALKRLLDLEKEVNRFALANKLTASFPQVEPAQLYGIEINAYAHELAQVVVWIGYIQWLHDNGYGIPRDPILKPLHNIERKDAILAHDTERQLAEPAWPDADVIIGNPPFLGGKFLRRELGDAYVDALFKLYEGRVPHEADLVCYWFERARDQIDRGLADRAGLLANSGYPRRSKPPGVATHQGDGRHLHGVE